MSSYGIYLSGIGALGQSVRVDQIANNLANSNTPGFRRDGVSFRERLVEALEDRHDVRFYNAAVDRHGGAPFIDRVTFDRRGGGLEVTHRPLDLALNSEGFFTVQDLKGGGVYYTRAGNFVMDGTGRLLTADGRYQALAEDGRGLALDPNSGAELRAREDGTLFQGDAEIGRLGVADFGDASRLVKRGDNVFENLGGAAAAPAETRVEQGALERSSVNPIVEMVEMIKALRALESNLQMVRFQDAALDRTVNDFGRPQR
jgi:flagellar basal-body rod protein FlgG